MNTYNVRFVGAFRHAAHSAKIERYKLVRAENEATAVEALRNEYTITRVVQVTLVKGVRDVRNSKVQAWR